MIVPMKKVTVIVQIKDKGNLIERLGNLGVLHVEHIHPPSGREINLIKEDLEKINEAMGVIGSFEPLEEKEETGDWKALVSEIIELGKKLKDLEEKVILLKEETIKWEKWGEFEPDLVKELRGKNIFVKLYKIPVREIKNISEEMVIKEIFREKGLANCLVISDKEIKIPFEEISPLEMSLKELKKKCQEMEEEIAFLKKGLKDKSKFLDFLKKVKRGIELEKEFMEVAKGMGEERNLCYLKGYIPTDSLEKFIKVAQQEAWGIVVEEPSEEDNVPTLLRNPRWIETISYLFRVLEIYPGYRELDISMWFLIFLSIFFGMLIGDAGYGAIYLVLSFLAKKKWGYKIKEKSLFHLLYLLSISAIVWGLLNGTFFGQEWLSNFIKPMAPFLRNEKIVQNFCFFLGAIHLSIAHFWKLIFKFPHLRSLAELGWIFILWGVYFLARFLILGDLFPEFAKMLFFLGFLLIISFSHPQRNLIKGFAKGIGTLLLNLVGNFTDVVSYVRLFAVGLTSIFIADSFNKIAFDFGFRGFFSGLFASSILFLGHILNIILGPLSVLVHGVRLNLLEFSNHLEVKWIGFPYRPLKREEAR